MRFLIKSLVADFLFGTVQFQNVTRQLDMCIFLRLPKHILKERREVRNQEILAGTQHCTNLNYVAEHVYLWCLGIAQLAWIEPEGYWDSVCYPEYIKSHQHLFKDGDVENGAPREDLVNGLLVIEPEVKEKMDMTDIVAKVCLETIASVDFLV